MSERMREPAEIIADMMRRNGIRLLEFEGSAIRKLELFDTAPPAEPQELKLDDNPLANAAALADMRVRVRKEIEAELAADRDRFRFAASEGIPT